MSDNKKGAEQVFIQAHPLGGSSFYTRLRPLARRLLGVPGVRYLRPLARRVDSLAEPAGKVYVQYQPATAPGRECQTITVISANLWHAYPRFSRQNERLEDFVCMVKEQKAGILLLQEVTRRPGLRVDEWLADQLGMAYVYSRVNGHEPAIGFEEGLAVLSRYPIQTLHIKQLGLKVNAFVRRLALGATIDSPCGRLAVASVHLALRRRQNAHQLAQLYTWIHATADGLPIIIGGDFNAGEKSAQVRRAQIQWTDTYRLANPGLKGTTHTIRGPAGSVIHEGRLDYIFLHPAGQEWRVLEAHHMDGCEGPHSDHRAVLARLAVIPQPSE
jgi:endonuclease/exonuclease/phosphatase family metal-dependent hydrolase